LCFNLEQSGGTENLQNPNNASKATFTTHPRGHLKFLNLSIHHAPSQRSSQTPQPLNIVLTPISHPGEKWADPRTSNYLALQGELYIIDVSQAVDLDHPRALDFLREDATHVNAFFRRGGIATLSTRELFEFTVDPHINASNIDAALDRLCTAAASRPAATAAEDQTADNVGLNPPPIPCSRSHAQPLNTPDAWCFSPQTFWAIPFAD
jgi:hypothetical protein